MRVVAIIQARTGSTRLPAKVLKPLGSKCVLDRVIDRTLMASGLDQVVVATSDRSGDDPVATAVRSRGLLCLRGPESDVLARYAMAAAYTRADVVVRITADCPLVDPALIGEVVDALAKTGCPDLRYSSNVHPTRTFPTGFDVEAFGCSLLFCAARMAESDYDREHVTPWMQRSAASETVLSGRPSCSTLSFTLDTEEDYALLTDLLAHQPDIFELGWREITERYLRIRDAGAV